jgi:hypothetical protein
MTKLAISLLLAAGLLQGQAPAQVRTLLESTDIKDQSVMLQQLQNAGHITAEDAAVLATPHLELVVEDMKTPL